MKKNKKPPKWVVERFFNNRQLEIEIDFVNKVNNNLKLTKYGKR